MTQLKDKIQDAALRSRIWLSLRPRGEYLAIAAPSTGLSLLHGAPEGNFVAQLFD
jgi:hypothetical protein